MGLRLHRTIAEAGLPAREMQGETLLACGPEARSRRSTSACSPSSTGATGS